MDMQAMDFDNRGGQGNNQQVYNIQQQTDLESMGYGMQKPGRGKDIQNQYIISEDYLAAAKNGNKQGQGLTSNKYGGNHQ